MRVLVTGGAGYIGSVVTALLLAEGHDVAVFDDLSRGHREAIPKGVELVEGDVRNVEQVRQALAAFWCDAIVHLAGVAEVAESVKDPSLYADINTFGTAAVAQAAALCNVRRIVFSSTCAVYGQPAKMPITEDTPCHPLNPYGESKLNAERALQAVCESTPGLSYIALRYFNACGSDGTRGEHHEPESHLIPLAIRAALTNRPLNVYGVDYDTNDGTCVRDYVHVSDLARAHAAALLSIPLNRAVNLGTAKGSSVLSVLTAVEKVSRREVPYEVVDRRPGDPDLLVASNGLARVLWGWRPQHTLLDAVRDAWKWHHKHPHGYRTGVAR